MTTAAAPIAAPVAAPVEPLFAHAARLWLRVWGAVQGVAIVTACIVVLARDGGVRAFLARPDAARALLLLAALIAYHAVGLRAHAWILRRRWALVAFVPLGWGLVLLGPVVIGSTFGILMIGAVIQGFIFLPFSWAIGTLALAVSALLGAMLLTARSRPPSLVLAQVVGVAATGTMIGTVMLYIHRANRDAAVRSRLLAQLDAAQRDLAERAREAGVQEERQRLARDIHDTLAQGFTSVIKHLEAVELSFTGRAVPDDDAMRAALPHLAHAQAVSRASLAEIRRLVWALRPPQLAEAPLAAAIARIVQQWGEANGVATTCTLDPLPPLQPDADVIFLRATQESLSNVARHAGASRVAVTMHGVDGLVLLTVEDDGRGFAEPESAGAGTVGIAGMRERVRRFGGHVLLESAPGAGTSVTVALPLAAIVVSANAPNG